MDYKTIIEAALFVSGESGLSVSELSTLIDINDKRQIKAIMTEIMNYVNNNNNYAFEIVIFDNKYKMFTKPSLNEKLLKLAKFKYKNPLTKSLMEILTIIAYNGPITKKEIEKIKPGFKKIKVDEEGNNNFSEESNCDYSIRRLRELGLIEPLVLHTTPGFAYAYKVTGKFLDVFGLKSIKDLPKLKNYE